MKWMLGGLVLLWAVLALAAPAWAEGEDEAIVGVIERAYIAGIWMAGDEAAARGGFDPAFVMQVAEEEGALSASLDAWLERLGLDGEPLYTDYMSLYRFGDEWKIVAKTFHSHR